MKWITVGGYTVVWEGALNLQAGIYATYGVNNLFKTVSFDWRNNFLKENQFNHFFLQSDFLAFPFGLLSH